MPPFLDPAHAPIRREISQKTDRLTLLIDTIGENLPLAVNSAKGGFFADATRQFQQLSVWCEHADAIRQDITQLSLDLERVGSSQLEMSLPASR